MDLRRCVPTLLLLWLALTWVCEGSPMQPSDRKWLEEGDVSYLVQPDGARNRPRPSQGGRRRPQSLRPRVRPRLSHKGPMPF